MSCGEASPPARRRCAPRLRLERSRVDPARAVAQHRPTLPGTACAASLSSTAASPPTVSIPRAETLCAPLSDARQFSHRERPEKRRARGPGARRDAARLAACRMLLWRRPSMSRRRASTSAASRPAPPSALPPRARGRAGSPGRSRRGRGALVETVRSTVGTIARTLSHTLRECVAIERMTRRHEDRLRQRRSASAQPSPRGCRTRARRSSPSRRRRGRADRRRRRAGAFARTDPRAPRRPRRRLPDQGARRSCRKAMTGPEGWRSRGHANAEADSRRVRIATPPRCGRRDVALSIAIAVTLAAAALVGIAWAAGFHEVASLLLRPHWTGSSSRGRDWSRASSATRLPIASSRASTRGRTCRCTTRGRPSRPASAS